MMRYVYGEVLPLNIFTVLHLKSKKDLLLAIVEVKFCLNIILHLRSFYSAKLQIWESKHSVVSKIFNFYVGPNCEFSFSLNLLSYLHISEVQLSFYRVFLNTTTNSLIIRHMCLKINAALFGFVFIHKLCDILTKISHRWRHFFHFPVHGGCI